MHAQWYRQFTLGFGTMQCMEIDLVLDACENETELYIWNCPKEITACVWYCDIPKLAAFSQSIKNIRMANNYHLAFQKVCIHRESFFLSFKKKSSVLESTGNTGPNLTSKSALNPPK